LFREIKNKKILFVSVFRTYIETTEQNCFVTNRNNPKFSEKYPNILSFKLFGWVFCLFRFNRNIKTLCFSIKAKQLKQTVSKQTEKNKKKTKKPEKNGKTLNLLYKIAKFAPYQTVSVSLLFVSVQSKHRKSLFRFRSETTETNVLLRIVPKLVSVPVSVVSNRKFAAGVTDTGSKFATGFVDTGGAP